MTIAEPYQWRDDAACLDVGPDWFFPEDNVPARWAKEVCASCPVAAQCLAEALENQEQFGIWGGLNLKERRRLTRTNASS